MAISDGSQGDHKSIVYIVPAAGGTPKRVTEPGHGPSYWHVWSPDGKTLAFVGERANNFDIYAIPAAGGEETRLTTAPGLDDGPEYSPDGQYIYFDSYPTRDAAIFRVRINDHKLERVANIEGLRRAQSSVLSFPWMGLAPDDSPILLRDNGTQEIYALDLQLP